MYERGNLRASTHTRHFGGSFRAQQLRSPYNGQSYASRKVGQRAGSQRAVGFSHNCRPYSTTRAFSSGSRSAFDGSRSCTHQFPLDLDDTNVSDDTYRFLAYLDLATNSSQETAVDDFARELLHIVGFEERGRILRTRHIIPLSICGENNTVAQTDVCLVDQRSTILLLLVLREDKTIFNPSDPEPRVIAEAIAAYQHNNQRRKCMGLPTLNTMTIPCITMVWTRPTFYLVPVTRELGDAVITGQWPEVETKVLMCVTVAGRHRRLSESMEVPEYRRVAFQRMIAFKAIAKSHWEKFLVD